MPQRLLGVSALVDIGQQDVPAQDTPVGVAKRDAAHLKPSIDTVESPKASLKIVRRTRRDPVPEDLTDALMIVAMDRVIRPPLLQLLQRPAAIGDELIVDELDLTVRRHARDQTGNALHDQARMALALA